MYRTKYDRQSKLWSGKNLEPVYNPKISIGQIVLRALVANRSRIAQISDDTGIEMTFNEIRIKAIRAAINLHQMGYKANDIFGFMARNSTYVAPIVFASIFNGCPLSTLDPSYGKDKLLHMLGMSRPCLMFCDVSVYELVSECLKELKINSNIFTFDGQIGDSKSVDTLFAAVDDVDAFSPVNVDGENDVVMILRSSGTTGLPKGIRISHAVLANTIANTETLNCDDIMLCFTTVEGIHGVITLFSGTITGAKRIITTSIFTPETQFRMVKEHKITHILSQPDQVSLSLQSEQLKTANLSSVLCQRVGGSSVPFGQRERWNKYLKNGKNFYASYGLNDLGGPISIDYPESGKEGTAGQLLHGNVIKIIDGNGERCEPNVNGEICVKTPYKFLGYMGNEQAVTRALYDSEGFVVTGDIGRFDGDGYLYVVGRKVDILVYQGNQIFPSEIENCLMKHTNIDSVCVVGVPDGNGSDLPAAVVIRSKDRHIIIEEDEVMGFVAQHFGDLLKLSGGIYFVEAFPMSAAYKLIRRQVRDFAIESFKQKQSIMIRNNF